MGAGRLLFGRDGDVAAMHAAADAAARGTGSTVLITGPPGIGKTALVNEFAGQRRAGGDTVLVGRGSPDPGAPGYWPWTQILTQAWEATHQERARRVLGGRLAHLRSVVPALAVDLDEGSNGDVEVTGTAYALYDAAISLLAMVPAERPAILVIDDLHHADSGSWGLLDLVVRGAVGARLLVVAASRVGEGDLSADHREQLTRLSAYGRRIDLAGLGDDEIEAVLAAGVGAQPSAAVVETVSRLTGGNPLFINELSVALAGGEDIVDLERHAPSLIAAINRVVGTLNATGRGLLARAAIIGPEFDEQTLTGLTEDADPLRPTLNEIARLGLVEAVDDGRWRFSHELLRDAVLSDLPGDRRADLHARCAETLAATEPGRQGRVGEIARHLLAAARAGGPVAPALRFCRLAGTNARARFAHSEAEYWWSAALDLARQDPDVKDDERLELLLELGSAQTRAGGAQRARETYQRARTLAGHLDDPVGAARAAIGYADARTRGPGRETELQDLRADLQSATAALDEAEQKHPLVLALALGQLASCLAVSSEPEVARAVARRAVEVAMSDGSPDAHQAALTAQRFAALDSTTLSERSQITEQLMLLALQNNDPEAEWSAARWRLTDGLEAGDPDRVIQAASTTARLADRLLEPELRVHSLIHDATIALLEGRFDDVDDLHRQITTMADGVDVSLESVLGQALFESRERGDLDIGGLRLILEARPLPVYRALVCWGSANLRRPDDTRADLRRFFDEQSVADLPDDVYLLAILAMLAEAVTYVDDRDRAAEIRDRLAPFADRCVLAGVGPYVWTGSGHHYMAQLCLTLGDLDEASAHAEAALDVHRRMGANPWVVRTQFTRALIGAARGDRTSARAQFEHVRSRARTLSMQAIADVADSELAALGGRLATPGERWALRRSGAGWRLTTPRGAHVLPDRKGLGFLTTLLSRPSQEIHVVDLGSARGAVDAGGAGAVLDDTAKEMYRRRVEDLRDQITEGTTWGDHERAARAQVELDAIADELRSAVGLGGRDRRAADGAERARINVTRAIRSAIAAVGEADPDVGEHLTTTIRTGSYCVYEPDPASAIEWET